MVLASALRVGVRAGAAARVGARPRRRATRRRPPTSRCRRPSWRTSASCQARTTTWETTVRTTGTVDWDNDHTTQAITQVSGPITRIAVDTGTRVKAGDPLLYVASADVANAVSSYRKAKNRLDLAQKTLDRSRDLLGAQGAGAARLRSGAGRLQRRVDRRADVAAGAEGVRRHAPTTSTTAEAAERARSARSWPMRAPLAGTIVQKLVLPGQFIQAGATVGVRHQQRVDGLGAGARLRQGPARRCTSATRSTRGTRSLPETFHGVVSYIGDMIDPATRTTPVRIVTAERRRAAEEGPVPRRRDPRPHDAGRARRADDGGAVRRAELSVRLRPGRSRASSPSGW